MPPAQPLATEANMYQYEYPFPSRYMPTPPIEPGTSSQSVNLPSLYSISPASVIRPNQPDNPALAPSSGSNSNPAVHYTYQWPQYPPVQLQIEEAQLPDTPTHTSSSDADYEEEEGEEDYGDDSATSLTSIAWSEIKQGLRAVKKSFDIDSKASCTPVKVEPSENNQINWQPPTIANADPEARQSKAAAGTARGGGAKVMATAITLATSTSSPWSPTTSLSCLPHTARQSRRSNGDDLQCPSTTGRAVSRLPLLKSDHMTLWKMSLAQPNANIIDSLFFRPFVRYLIFYLFSHYLSQQLSCVALAHLSLFCCFHPLTTSKNLYQPPNVIPTMESDAPLS